MALVEEKTGDVDQVQRLKLVARRLGLLNHGREYQNRCRMLFDGIDLKGKSMLEIGCGKGLLCLWAKIHGASDVVGLEPLAQGAYDSSQCYLDFKTIVTELGLENIDIVPSRLEDYRPANRTFDVVLSLASINHLDETSCIELRRSETARANYVSLFNHVRGLMSPGGTLIVVDASSSSFFGDLHLTNPFNPHIEWFKHQRPEIWAQLLSRCRFSNPKISWLSGSLLGHIGVPTIPKTLSYFLSSAFRLEMDCT
jgi:cyclopropane fatty-acyl-phospholipid synthase-like methyltransferase